MKDKLIPALYDTKWYNGGTFEYEEGFISNRELFMVGMPRLRQIRINPGNAHVVLFEKYVGPNQNWTGLGPSGLVPISYGLFG